MTGLEPFVIMGIAALLGLLAAAFSKAFETINRTQTILMLGPRGVGKTTALMGMQNAFASAPEVSDQLGFAFNASTKDRVQEHKDLINSWVVKLRDRASMKYGALAPSVPGTMNRNTFTCYVSSKDQGPPADAKNKVTLQFNDYPGGAMLLRGDNARMEAQLVTDASSSDVYLICIDTPYLMEDEGKYHVSRNRPDALATLFERSNPFLQEGKNALVLLVPIRTERYFNDGRSLEMLTAVKRGYRSILSTCADSRWRHRVRVVVCPIQSLGIIEFATLGTEPDSELGHPAAYFRLDPYLPEDRRPTIQVKNTHLMLFEVLAHILFKEIKAGAGANQAEYQKALDKFREVLAAKARDFEVIQKGPY